MFMFMFISLIIKNILFLSYSILYLTVRMYIRFTNITKEKLKKEA